MMSAQAGKNDSEMRPRRERKENGKRDSPPASKLTRRMTQLAEGNRILLRYLDGIRERCGWIESVIVKNRMTYKRFANDEALQSLALVKIFQISQIVSNMEVIFPNAEFWLEKRKENESRQASHDNSIPLGKISFLDIKSCRNDHGHAIEIDTELLYQDIMEFIPNLNDSVNFIMRHDFHLDDEDFKYLRSNPLTRLETLINLIDADERKGRILKKVLFDRVNGNDDYETIRNLKRESKQGFLLAYEQIAFSLNLNDCYRLYNHYAELGELAEFFAENQDESEKPK